MDESGIVDRLVVAVQYAYDRAGEVAARFGLDRVAGAVAGASLAWGAMAIEAAHAADTAHDAAVQLGMTTEEYTRWAYVVERAGGQVEHLRVGMTMLQRQLAAARAGTEGSAAAFRALGLGAEVASGKLGTSAQAFPRVLAALAEIEDDGKRAALSLQVLGEAGPRLAGLLDLGSDGIETMTKRAAALGVVIEDDVADASGDLVDALDDLGLYARGVSRDVGFALVPALGRAASATRDWLIANDDIIDQQLDRTVGRLGQALDVALGHPLGRAVLGAGALATAWGTIGAARSMGQALAAASPLAAAITSQAGALLAGARAMGPYAVAAAGVALVLDDLAVAADDGDSAILRLAESMGVRSEAREAIASTRDLLYDAAAAAWEMAGALSEGLAGAIDRLRAMLPSLDVILEPMAEALRGGVGGALETITERNRVAAEGFGKFAGYLRGDPGVAYVGGGGNTTVNVAVSAGPSAQQIADAAAEETRRQVLAAVQAAAVQ